MMSCNGNFIHVYIPITQEMDDAYHSFSRWRVINRKEIKMVLLLMEDD